MELKRSRDKKKVRYLVKQAQVEDVKYFFGMQGGGVSPLFNESCDHPPIVDSFLGCFPNEFECIEVRLTNAKTNNILRNNQGKPQRLQRKLR
jgi:hypothetical protein